MAEAALQTRWAREYETVYILRPGATPEEADRVSSRISEVLQRLEGKLVKVDNWGKRRLAYPIKKLTRGIFIYVKYVGYGDLVAEIERNLRLLDSVIRYQTVLLRSELNPAEVEVDPEEIKFVPIEITEEEHEPDLAQRLGLDEAASSMHHAPRGQDPYAAEAKAAAEAQEAPEEQAAAEAQEAPEEQAAPEAQEESEETVEPAAEAPKKPASEPPAEDA